MSKNSLEKLQECQTNQVIIPSFVLTDFNTRLNNILDQLFKMKLTEDQEHGIADKDVSFNGLDPNKHIMLQLYVDLDKQDQVHCMLMFPNNIVSAMDNDNERHYCRIVKSMFSYADVGLKFSSSYIEGAMQEAINALMGFFPKPINN